MAGIIAVDLHSGSPLLGSPVYFRVQAESRSGVAFQRAKIKSTVKMFLPGASEASDEQDYESSKPIIQDGDIYIDVSSALRSVADTYEYECRNAAGSLSYPILTLNIRVWDEYMEDGVYYSTEDDAIVVPTTFHFLLGAFTDLERIQSGLSRSVTTLTRKPDGEVIPLSSPLYIYPAAFSYSDSDWFAGVAPSNPQSIAVVPTNALVVPGRSVFPADVDDEYTTFQFVNGYGVLETICAVTFPDDKVTKDIKEYTISTPMQFNKINRNVARKTASRHSFAMSSGPVTEEWQAWWQEEFLNTQQCWVWMRGQWLPCSIIPATDTAGINHAAADLPEVKFTVKLNIEG